jgi:hypothetical protein
MQGAELLACCRLTSRLAEELLDSPPSRWQAVADTLEWELQSYEDLTPAPGN